MEPVRIFDIAFALEQMNKIPKPSPRVVACIETLEDTLCRYVEGFCLGKFVPDETPRS